MASLLFWIGTIWCVNVGRWNRVIGRRSPNAVNISATWFSLITPHSARSATFHSHLIFLDQELISCRYLFCCYCACAWWGESLKRSLYMLRRFEIWQDCSSSKCASTDRRRIFDLTSHTVKMAAVTSFHAEKCCHLVSGAYAATYASSWSIVHS